MKACRQALICIAIWGVLASTARADSEQVLKGKALFAESCSLCHGADGKRGEAFQTPLWGEGSQIKKFENAQALFEYNQLLMPFNDPSLLTDEQKWAVVAFLLASHGSIPGSATISPESAPGVSIK